MKSITYSKLNFWNRFSFLWEFETKSVRRSPTVKEKRNQSIVLEVMDNSRLLPSFLPHEDEAPRAPLWTLYKIHDECRWDERQCVSDVIYKGKHDKCHCGGAVAVQGASSSCVWTPRVHACQINVNVKRELKIFISQRRRSNKLDLSFCLQFVLLSGLDHFPASACHVKPFYSD